MIANDRIHHPSCAARNGGLCTGCPTTETKPVVAAEAQWRFTCQFGETHFATGPNPDETRRQFGCGCTEVAS